jgi:hypothetical protein
MLSNTFYLNQVRFPHTTFFIEIEESQYMAMDLSQPILLFFNYKTDVVYGLLGEIQTLERSSNGRIKIQLKGKSRVRAIFNH